ncbi:hypothetical protein [Primorskyibacter sp. S87]|uniref:hypothetical protein n=1 Tax=Primorskyibacter sp. S87 TaxID=3415126 RepID=UPI003C7D0709
MLFLSLPFMALLQPAYAGAWLREPGTAFLAATMTARSDPNLPGTSSTLYAEYGLWPALTLGLDINEHGNLTGHALAFLRLPMARNLNDWSLAIELAAGADHIGPDWARMQKLTLSAGRGFQSPWGNGWFLVDTAFEYRSGLGQAIYKLDTTLGLSTGSKLRPLLQIETSQIKEGEFFWTVTPSLMFDWKDTTWLIGFERKSIQSGVGVKLGLWQTF